MDSQYTSQSPLDFLKGILAVLAIPGFFVGLGVTVEWLASLA
ncbi:hypothetical protein PV726_32820 [Streptomyces europaeiscabiei]|nr:hypothetical protein [Streptomyces europaeiscabiei]MDX3695040.1 hypothetical protein [Streptomyces europaeiscabiei]